MARRTRRTRSRSTLAVAFLCAGLVGAVLLTLMRGMFTVGEDMLASTEDSRPLSGRARGGGELAPSRAGYVRAAEHVDLPPPSIPAESSDAADGGTIVISGRVDFPPEVPSDEAAVVVLERFDRERIRLEAPVQDDVPFRFSTWSVSALCGPTSTDPRIVVLGAGAAPASVELVCPRGVSLRGRVVDADGAPVRGASVSVFARDERAGTLRTAQNDVVESDANGRFAFDGVEPLPNTLDVVAKHRHWRSEIVTVALGEGLRSDPLELRLLPTGTLRVRAVGPSGRGAVRASVAWIDVRAVEFAVDPARQRTGPVSRERDGAEDFVLRARSGSLSAHAQDGELLTLPAGTYFVRAYEAQWRSATRRVTVTPDEEIALDLELAEGVELVVETSQAFEDLRPSFELVDERRAPMGRLLVGRLPRRMLEAANPPGVHGFRSQRTFSDGQRAPGQRRTTALLPGTYRMHVTTEDGRRIEREVVVPVAPAGGAVRIELDTDR